MKLTYTAVFADLVNDFYQKNEILVICLAVIVLLLLFIMIFISISKSKHVQALKRMNEVAEESRQLQNAFIANMTMRYVLLECDCWIYHDSCRNR